MKLCVEKMGKEKIGSIHEFEALTGAAYKPLLDFEDSSIAADISKRIKKLHANGELTREQLWLGSYYKKEIETAFLPDLAIRWIDDTIGWGVFAAKAFKKMEFIAEYSGKVRRRKSEDKKNAYCFEYVIAPHVASPYTIDGRDQGGIGRFINHSDHPNLRSTLATCDWINHVILIADQPIQKGEQLFYDYGPDYWSGRSKPKAL